MALAAETIQQPSFSTPEELDDLLLEGKRSGEPIDVTPAFWKMMQAELHCN